MKTLEEIIEQRLDAEGNVDLEGAAAEMNAELEKIEGVPPMVALQANEAYIEHILHQYIGPLILQIGHEAGVLTDSYEDNIAALHRTLKFNKLRFFYRLAYQFWKAQHGLTVVKNDLRT